MDIHFNGYKIRYVMLNEFIRPIRSSQHIETVNIFINLDDIFHTLHRPLVDKEFQACGAHAGRQLVSNVFNIIGHYRNWALKEHIKPMVFAYYSSASVRFRNNMYIPEYRKHFFEINRLQNGNYYFINDAIQKAYSIFRAIAKYIPNVYVIDTKHLEPAILPMYIHQAGLCTTGPSSWSIVVSRDTYDLQYCYLDRWSMIAPKGDYSLLITRKEMWSYVCTRERVYKDPKDLHFIPQLYPACKAIVGDYYRNIKRLRSVGWKTLFNYMESVEGIDEPTPEVLDIQISRFSSFLGAKKIDENLLVANINCTSIETQVGMMLDADKALIATQLEEMEDYVALGRMNNELFHDYPLNLAFLCNQPVTGGFQWN